MGQSIVLFPFSPFWLRHESEVASVGRVCVYQEVGEKHLSSLCSTSPVLARIKYKCLNKLLVSFNFSESACTSNAPIFTVKADIAQLR